MERDFSMKNYNYFISSILYIFFISASISSAQDVDSLKDMEKKSLQIDFINEGALFYFLPVSNELSLRSGLSINWNYNEKKDGEGSSQFVYNGVPDPNEIKSAPNSLSNKFELTASSVLFYSLDNYEFAKFYIGIGPALKYSFNKLQKDSLSDYNDSSKEFYSFESINKAIGIGAILSIFVQSHLYKNIYLVSEYRLSGFYNWNTDNSNNYHYYQNSPIYSNSSSRNTNLKSHEFSLEFGSIKIGLLMEL